CGRRPHRARRGRRGHPRALRASRGAVHPGAGLHLAHWRKTFHTRGSTMTALLRPTPDGFPRAGETHLVISGAIHYFRVHPEQWRDRLRRLVAMGCDHVETYVAWTVHQPGRGVTTFGVFADHGRFLDTAAEEGLDAIVRPGPYICAEWENGGFPGWILAYRNL